ncbi:unnamed protein product [Cunninghamella blakesleeana]
MASTDFCIRLPKIEAHAHINGSLSPNTMRELVALKKDMNPELAAFKIPDSLDSINDFFGLFKFIYQLTDDETSVKIATQRVIEEFAKDGVKYLELRTTPRANPDKNMTKSSYIAAVLETIKKMNDDENLNIIVKLILAIDRRNTLEEAEEVVDLALKYRDQQDNNGIIVGIDLCGDVTKGSFKSLQSAFERAKQHDFFITLHFNEIEENIVEAPDLLSIHPNRLGHATLLDDFSRNFVFGNNIPIEICMTSNVLSKTVPTFEDHHIKNLLLEDHPFILCTDDKGVFFSDLSNEYKIASDVFNLSREQLYEASFKAIDYIFGNQEFKDKLKTIWANWKIENKALFD